MTETEIVGITAKSFSFLTLPTTVYILHLNQNMKEIPLRESILLMYVQIQLCWHMRMAQRSKILLK